METPARQTLVQVPSLTIWAPLCLWCHFTCLFCCVSYAYPRLLKVAEPGVHGVLPAAARRHCFVFLHKFLCTAVCPNDICAEMLKIIHVAFAFSAILQQLCILHNIAPGDHTSAPSWDLCPAGHSRAVPAATPVVERTAKEAKQSKQARRRPGRKNTWPLSTTPLQAPRPQPSLLQSYLCGGRWRLQLCRLRRLLQMQL